MHLLTPFSAVVLLAAIAVAQSFAADTPPKDADGFAELFNGANLDGWVVEGTKSYREGGVEKPVWTVKDGAIDCARNRGFGFLRHDQEFTDFELHLEYRQQPKSNSGIGIRYDRFTGTVNSRPSMAGYEIQLLDDGDKPPNEHSTGSLYRYVAPKTSAAKPAGQWNELSIECRGPKIKVVLNGHVVQDVDQRDVPAIASKPLRGHIALQNHGGGAEFRAIKIKKLN